MLLITLRHLPMEICTSHIHKYLLYLKHWNINFDILLVSNELNPILSASECKMVQSDQQIYDLLGTRLKSIDKNSSKEVRDSEKVVLCFKGFTVDCPRLPLVKESKFFEAVFMNKNFSDSGEETFVLNFFSFHVIFRGTYK